FFLHAEDGIRGKLVTGVQTCALPISAVLGRVHVEQMAEWRGVGGRLLLGKDPEPRGDDEPPVVAQDGATVLVAGDRPEGQHPRRSEERRVGRERWSRRSSGPAEAQAW